MRSIWNLFLYSSCTLIVIDAFVPFNKITNNSYCIYLQVFEETIECVCVWVSGRVRFGIYLPTRFVCYHVSDHLIGAVNIADDKPRPSLGVFPVMLRCNGRGEGNISTRCPIVVASIFTIVLWQPWMLWCSAHTQIWSCFHAIQFHKSRQIRKPRSSPK